MVDPLSGVTFNQLINTINRNQSGLQDSLERISSCRKLNRAGTPNPAANALSAQLRLQISALTQSVSNVESGDNFIITAEGGLAVVADLVNRVRQLAIQSSNCTLNDSQRETLNQEFRQVHKKYRPPRSLRFNGQNLLDGTLGQNADPLNIQAGAESGPENQMILNVVESTSTQSLGVDNADISTAQGARCRRWTILHRPQSLNAARGQVGAVGNRLVSTSNSLNIQIENLTLNESGQADTDLTEKASNLQQGLLRFETSIRSLASQLQNKQSQSLLLDFINQRLTAADS